MTGYVIRALRDDRLRRELLDERLTGSAVFPIGLIIWRGSYFMQKLL